MILVLTLGVMSMLNFLYSAEKLAWLHIFLAGSAFASSGFSSPPSSFFSSCADSLYQIGNWFNKPVEIVRNLYFGYMCSATL